MEPEADEGATQASNSAQSAIKRETSEDRVKPSTENEEQQADNGANAEDQAEEQGAQKANTTSNDPGTDAKEEPASQKQPVSGPSSGFGARVEASGALPIAAARQAQHGISGVQRLRSPFSFEAAGQQAPASNDQDMSMFPQSAQTSNMADLPMQQPRTVPSERPNGLPPTTRVDMNQATMYTPEHMRNVLGVRLDGEGMAPARRHGYLPTSEAAAHQQLQLQMAEERQRQQAAAADRPRLFGAPQSAQAFAHPDGRRPSSEGDVAPIGEWPNIAARTERAGPSTEPPKDAGFRPTRSSAPPSNTNPQQQTQAGADPIHLDQQDRPQRQPGPNDARSGVLRAPQTVRHDLVYCAKLQYYVHGNTTKQVLNLRTVHRTHAGAVHALYNVLQSDTRFAQRQVIFARSDLNGLHAPGQIVPGPLAREREVIHALIVEKMLME